MFPPRCGDNLDYKDPDAGLAGRPDALYALRGMQVEPEAAYWGESPRPLPHVVPTRQVLDLTLDSESPYYVRPYTDYEPYYDTEIEELAYLEGKRNDDIKTAGAFDYPTGYYFGDNPAMDPVKYEYLPISDFIQLHSPPFGTIFNIRDNFQYLVQDINQQHLRRDIPAPADPRTELVSTGRELARMFEIETPGLLHRHALNLIFYKRAEISPRGRVKCCGNRFSASLALVASLHLTLPRQFDCSPCWAT